MIVRQFPFPIEELHLEHTLICGQAFRWHLDAEGWWSCVLPVMPENGRRDDVLIRLRQDTDTVYYEATHADALAVITDWSEYRNPDFDRIKSALRKPNIVDGRNLYKPNRMVAGGFTYVPLGRCGGGICGEVK